MEKLVKKDILADAQMLQQTIFITHIHHKDQVNIFFNLTYDMEIKHIRI